MRREFERWMVKQERKKPNTAYQYAQSIDKVSNHYSTHTQQNTDLYRILDTALLEQIKDDYSLHGKFSDFGGKGNGTIRNAVATYYRYRMEWALNSSASASSTQQAVTSSTCDEGQELEDNPTFNLSYERDLQSSMVLQIDALFPEHQIYGGEALEGVEFSINGKRIDILLEHRQNKSLLAIELKAGIGDFKVFGQIAMYLGLLEERFPDRSCNGVIICGQVDESLALACKMSNRVTLKQYEMQLVLVDYN
ncbi:PDDEXK nuclease domain-containing protein [Vibrio brasiliensis]|nr:PDDEXK nuclease domain-containing protein [Vibrio brasiliensis]